MLPLLIHHKASSLPAEIRIVPDALTLLVPPGYGK